MRRVSILVLAFFAALPSFAAQPAHLSRSRLAPCKVPGKGGQQVDALCGTYEVWENREAKAGRKIGLKIVVLPARSANPLPDPVLDLAGGPGAADTPIAGSVADSPLLQERDLVFIDQRGTGEPDRLGCRLGSDDLQSRLGEMFPLDAVRRCRDELAKKYDLTLYTVAAAVDDFDEIVDWLGYPKVNLFSGSYGTRTAQVYLRRHPESVRSAVLWGVVPMDEPVALSHAAGGQRALDLTFAACEEDAACRAKFPDVRKDFQAVMDRLSQGPVEIEVSDPGTGQATRARFSREVIAEGIRIVLYSSEASAALPLLFHQAAAGDWKPLAQTVVQAKAGLEEIITRGLFFSVTCSQDFPFIDPAEVPARTAGSFLGDYRVRQQTAACALWPHARIDPKEREAIHSDIPVLLISGERDPVTPPDFARRASRFLTHSLHVVEPGASHEDSPPCVIALMDDFIRRGTTEGLDTSSCLAQVKPRSFLFELPDEGITPFKSAAQQAPKLELKPCTTTPGLPPEARCGTYEVWENRTAKSGRKIPLRVAVIPALGPDRLPEALTFFTGGPGESNVGSGPEVLDLFGALRRRRDILLVDFRGTGGSGGLFCPEMQGSAGVQGLLDSYYPPEKVKACAERLAKTADFSQYTNDTSVDDVDEVRAALGYPRLDIYGGSGGSRTALVYLRRHPDKVRTATIAGVAPPDERGPFFMARHAQRALDGLIAECEADAACHGAFPRLRDEVAAVLQRAEKEPVAVPVIDGETGKTVEVRLTRSGVAQTLRYMLYRPLAASILPLTIHLAAQGDWTLLAETGAHFASGRDFGGLADGYYLSLTCSEDVLFIREDEIPAAVQGTFLGDFRIRKQQAACAAWPVPPVDRRFLDPVVSDVPTLLLSGERDPVTPPVSAERAARTLENSLSVVVPDGGHGYFGVEGAMECTDGLMARLIETGTVKGLDTSCLARTKRAEFALRWDPEVELPADQLAPLTGTYQERTSGLGLTIETAGHRLKLLQGEYPPTVLMAVSPTRFRVEGMGFSTFVDFQITNGQATALTVPWAPAERWERKDKVDEYIQAEMQRRKIPGLSVAVLRDGEIIKAKGYGLANVELDVAATPETIYQSGSIGKQFTATLVMMLVEEGKLRLDDHIGKYFPDAPAIWKDITVRHLLTHTSGLSYANLNLRQDYTEDELVRAIAALPLDFQPGDQWAYSNEGYEVLGVLLHKATGKFHGDLLREKIFGPLGMTTARIISEADIVPNRADGYRLVDGELKNQEWVSPILNTTADGALYLTALDMAKWDAALSTEKLLKRASLDLMWTPAKLNDGKAVPYGYGFGWMTGALRGQRFVRHGGGWQGFSTHILRYVDKKLTVIALANLGGVNAATLADGIVGLYEPELAPREHTAMQIDPKAFDQYAGEYEIMPGAVLTFSREGDRFWMQATGQGRAELLPESETTFFTKVADITVTFVRDGNGAVTHLILRQSGGDVEVKKIK